MKNVVVEINDAIIMVGDQIHQIFVRDVLKRVVILWPITIEIVSESLHSDGATFGTSV